jgi:hypothetical protein
MLVIVLIQTEDHDTRPYYLSRLERRALVTNSCKWCLFAWLGPAIAWSFLRCFSRSLAVRAVACDSFVAKATTVEHVAHTM